MKYDDIQGLHRDQRALISNKYDDWNLVTGRVGKGKSKWARKNARKLDPTFNLDRIHFNQDAFWDDYINLRAGQCIILDEFDGHRRAAMRGERLSFLERMKRTRSRRVHAWIVYDRVSNLDRDLLTDRNAYWHHAEVRGVMQIRKPDTKLAFTMKSEPIEPTSYPVVGTFPFTEWEPPGFEAAYDAKKDREMNIFGATEKVEDPWMKPDLLLEAIAKRRLGIK